MSVFKGVYKVLNILTFTLFKTFLSLLFEDYCVK